MGFVTEFRNFAVKGNVVDMAVGVVIGAGFGKIVSSLVQDVITPPLGLLLGGVDFSHLSITLNSVVGNAQAVTINYGKFLQSVFDFTIIAFAMFLVITFFNKVRKAQEMEVPESPAVPTNEEKLLSEIRDILKNSASSK